MPETNGDTSQKQPQKNAADIDSLELRNVLVGQNYVDPIDFDKAEIYAMEHNSSTLDRLLSQGLVNKDIIGQAISEHFGVPYADLNSTGVPPEHVEKIPPEVAHTYRAVYFKEDENSVTIATDNVSQEGLVTRMSELFPGKEVKIAHALPEDIDDALGDFRQPLDTRFAQMLRDESVQPSDILDEIFQDALSFKASDIHLEPLESTVIVRFRVDGVLQDAGGIPKEYYSNIVNRIKVSAHLRIDTHNKMQDGSMQYESDKVTVDMRVSIAPTLEGEKVVIRLLAEYIRDFSLSGLGLNAEQEGLMKTAAQKPFGMILVVGPTGSGKTTTLYAVLKILNTTSVNITTIEDPVEYRISGINQIQVNEDADITFADGLRTIVRQDPDIILVGEIRDRETNKIALNAALTGHLVLSTFHANDAATGIPRLIDMGAEPFLVASTLEVILAQRLVRTICNSCRHSVEKTREEIAQYAEEAVGILVGENEESATFYEGSGCKVCGHTGYHGRSALYEIIEVTKEMKELVMSSPSGEEVRQLARQQGSRSMFENGLKKVEQGETTLEELIRVVGPQAHHVQ